jgi:hypothetical protein
MGKVVKVRKLDYITTGTVRSGTHFFCVPKGDSDIRLVYNGTGCGLNANVWAPRFGLPMVKNTLCSLLPGRFGCGRPVPQLQVARVDEGQVGCRRTNGQVKGPQG